ncbi:ABC transporter substrate-binding protein [Phycisphaerales bacterium AB-hyl4]|uniref:ABC transporter substrate-binding protein n=1 Tax=Natronomicrosphaera hydrolytica TaxID=3242702 RepID=A0ABV4U5S2_9BACT
MAKQELVDQVLWGQYRNRIRTRTVRELDPKSGMTPESWQRCDVLQVSTFDLHMAGMVSEFEPVPADLCKIASACFAPEVLEQCCSHDGQLMMLPIITNPTVCYAHRPAFEKAGLALPLAGWSWPTFVETCRTLRASHERPLGLFPVSGLTFEPMMWAHDCDYFDAIGGVSLPRESFHRSMSLLRELLNEQLCVDMYELLHTPWDYLRSGNICLTFMGPDLTRTLGDALPDWSLVPLPHNGSPVTPVVVFGLVVPRGQADTDRIWDLLRDMFADGRFSALGEVSKIFPAHIDGQHRWAGNGVQNANIMRQSLEHSRFLPARKGFMRWVMPVYRILTQVMHGETDIEIARCEIRRLLQESRIHRHDLLAIT